MILGRDDKVAPYVNVSASTTGKVGDFYTYLSGFLKPRLDAIYGESETLDSLIDNFSTYARDLAKRNSMTFSYSGTKFGFGNQHWEDRHKYNKGNDDLTGSNLTRKDCRKLGNEMYGVCEDSIKGGAAIMKFLKDGVSHHKGGAVISWTMPDGFKAFQIADKSKSSCIHGVIGTRKVSVKYYTFQDIPDVAAHKNGIAPNWVHSYDSYLLRQIVNTMPEDAPISTVHDQFSTASCYVEDLQSVAKDAYKKIADRDEAERTCAEAFGIHRPLPKVGNWKVEEIDEAEFIIS